MTDLDRALDLLLAHEGGWSNHAADRGGATMFGVTQGTYNDWRRKKKLPLQPVSRVEKAELRRLYDEGYWLGAGCDKLPWPLSYMVFDAAVNSGCGRAVTWLQTGLGVLVDTGAPRSRVGPKTIAAAKRAVDDGQAGKLLGIIRARADFIADLVKRDASQAVFLKGWWRRTLDVLTRALVEA